MLVLGSLLTSGCTPSSSPQRASTVVYASGADLQSINPLLTVHPLAKAVQKHVLFMTLATYDSTLLPIPRLAHWEWTADRRSLTFRLRADVRWHDGAPTTAHDVVWTLTMAMEPAVAYPRARDLANIVTVEALDSLTARVVFERPPPVFPDVFTDLPILPARHLDSLEPGQLRSASFNQRPVGNGPFEFVEYRPNQRWTFRRVDGFPHAIGRPDIERFVVAVVDESATKLAALTTGELDFAGINPAHTSFVAANPRLTVIDYPLQFVYGLIWNLRRLRFQEVEVRRALTMALDRQLLVDAYVYGFGIVAHGPVPPEHPWHAASESGIPFDPPAARALLDSAGWRVGAGGVRERGGVQMAFELLTVGSGAVPLEQMISAQLGKIGVAVTIRQRELSSFLAVAQSETRDYDALVMGIPGDWSLGHVSAMFQSTDAGPLAYSGYASAAFDDVMRRVREATIEGALVAAWREAQLILERDLPTTWLYHARGVQGANRRVRNSAIDLRGELARITDWTIGN